MRMPTLAIVVLLTQGLASSVHASNREVDEPIFKRPKGDGVEQIFLGTVEVLAGTVLATSAPHAVDDLAKHGQTMKLIASTQEQAIEALKSVHQEERRLEKQITTIMNDAGSWENDSEGKKVLTPNARGKVNELRSRIYSRSESDRTRQMETQEVRLARYRAEAIRYGQDRGILPKSLQVVRRGTILYLFLNPVLRIWIWYAYDAHPTLSPIATSIEALVAE